MSTFALPDLGEGLAEAEIVSWHVGEGDHVVVDQPLLSVETEKAVVEIPSPKAGHIAKLLAKAGERVKVGAPVVEFEEGPHAESGTVMGRLAGATTSMPATQTGTTATPVRPVSNASGVLASPAVRARARELGVDLSAVSPAGPGNTITLADVQAATSNAPPRNGAEILRGARHVMATNMGRAWREVVHATVQDAADIHAWSTTEDVSGRLVRALIAGCKAETALNASFDGATLSLRANQTIDLGIAIDSPEGLFVPVLRDVARSSPQVWRSGIEAFKQRVQDRSLMPADMRGATITLSNFGSIAGRYASLIVMPPQVAILGVGRIMMQPAQAGEGVVLHRALPLSLTFDHRAVTGGMATRFLRAVIGDLETA